MDFRTRGIGLWSHSRELLTNFYLCTDVTANDLQALGAIGAPRVCIVGDLVESEGEIAEALFLVEMGIAEMMLMGKETVLVTIQSNIQVETAQSGA